MRRGPAVAGILLLVVLLFVAVLSLRGVTTPIATTVTQRIEGQPVKLPVSGTAVLAARPSRVRVLADVTIDLRAAQPFIVDVLRPRVDRADPCGESLKLLSAAVGPSEGIALLKARVEHERWRCTPQPERERSIEGTVNLELKPTIVEGGQAVRLEPHVASVDTDGLAGMLMRRTGLGAVVGGAVGAKILAGLDPKALTRSLPPELLAYDPVLQSATFVDLGGGGLGLRLTAIGYASYGTVWDKAMARQRK